MKKRILTLALAALLCLSLAACGGGNKTPSGGGENASSGSGNAPDAAQKGNGPTDNEGLESLAERAKEEDKGAWYNEDASGEDLFARHGLTDVVPDGCLYIRRWTEDPMEDPFVRTGYTFEVDHDPTPEEFAIYSAAIFDQVLAASDNGKVYVWEYNWETNEGDYVAVTSYEDTAPSDYSYYQGDRFWDVRVSSGDFDDYFVYKLEITTSLVSDDAYPEK